MDDGPQGACPLGQVAAGVVQAKPPRQAGGPIPTILRRIRRGSRDVVESAVSQLFDAAVQPHGVAASGEYRLDELARLAGSDPLSFRIGLLGGQPRLARVLATAAAAGGWDGGGAGSRMGLACHAVAGSYAAVLAEAYVGADQHVRVTRLVAAVDVGRLVSPEGVRQQVESGLIWGLANATGAAVRREGGLPADTRLEGDREALIDQLRAERAAAIRGADTEGQASAAEADARALFGDVFKR